MKNQEKIQETVTDTFPCDVEIDGDIYTSEEVCISFGFNHTDLMLRAAMTIIVSKYGNAKRLSKDN